MLTALIREFSFMHSILFEQVVEPVLYVLHLGRYTEAAYDATEFFLLGLLQIVLLYLLLRPLEAWRPEEHWENRRAVRSDILYTYLSRLGVIPLAIYACLAPVIDGIEGWLRVWGFIPPKLEDFIPGLLHYPFVSFICYLILIDFCDYWRHRFQHRSRVWWTLHSLHHSQRQLSLWADDRNHLLDDVLTGLWSTALAWIIGVPPGQFIAWIMVTRMVESLYMPIYACHLVDLASGSLSARASTVYIMPWRLAMLGRSVAAILPRSCRCGISCLARPISQPKVC